MNGWIRLRWSRPRCGPLTTLLWALSLAGWVLLSITPVNSRLRPDFWAMALTGLALGCTRIALQGQLRMCIRFERQTAEAVKQARDEGRAEAAAEADDRLRSSELVDRVTAEALQRVAAAALNERDPPQPADSPPAGRRSMNYDWPKAQRPTYDPNGSGPHNLIQLPNRAAS